MKKKSALIAGQEKNNNHKKHVLAMARVLFFLTINKNVILNFLSSCGIICMY